MNLRLDRLATLYLVSPVGGPAYGKKRAIPVLMYHGVGIEDHPERDAYYRTTVSPARFQLQMEQLFRWGFKTCTLAQALSSLNSSVGGVADKVVITFDDGFLDFYTGAFPALDRFGFTATMFLPTGFIADSVTAFNGRDCLTWAQIRELQHHGIEFGSHTVTHPQLRMLNPAEVKRELTDSKQMIEDKTGIPTVSFAYPYAFPQVDSDFKKMLRDTLEDAGYRNGVCTIVGRANRQSDPFFLERLPMNDLDDEALFRAKLSGAYDWVGSLQSVIKKIRSLNGMRLSRQ